jgi:hypothetical protein
MKGVQPRFPLSVPIPGLTTSPQNSKKRSPELLPPSLILPRSQSSCRLHWNYVSPTQKRTGQLSTPPRIWQSELMRKSLSLISSPLSELSSPTLNRGTPRR